MCKYAYNALSQHFTTRILQYILTIIVRCSYYNVIVFVNNH